MRFLYDYYGILLKRGYYNNRVWVVRNYFEVGRGWSRDTHTKC